MRAKLRRNLTGFLPPSSHARPASLAMMSTGSSDSITGVTPAASTSGL